MFVRFVVPARFDADAGAPMGVVAVAYELELQVVAEPFRDTPTR